ncbi:MAG: ribonuclease J [Granulosicoccus sp.]
MTPDASDLWFLPLGGCGEIGMNMNLYGHDDQWLMVDCGVTFRDADGTNSSGFDIQMPDPEFIAAQHGKLQGILLTHAHEDHIGAVAPLWRRLRCPVYATPFTAQMLHRKLAEHGLADKVTVHLVEPLDRFHIGVFDVEWIPNTHSIPSPCGLVIRTPAGGVFHTADWKLDPDPVVGHGFIESEYRKLGKEGINAMVCDSTCADQPGHSLSEGALYEGLHYHIRESSGRVVVACFGSNIARLHTLSRIATVTGRHLGLLGRSLISTAAAARAIGLWPDVTTLVESDHLGYLPRETVLLVATGSQGEPRTALNRLSHGSFRDLELDAGDTVIFSARAIPGNEDQINNLIARLEAKGIRIITPESSELAIHASGHPGAEELRKLYDWVRPQLLIPVHGETVHLDAQTELARASGIRRQLNGRNGDLFTIAPTISIRRGAVPVGRLGIGSKSLEQIT